MAKIKKQAISRQPAKRRLPGSLNVSKTSQRGRKAKRANLRISRSLNLSISFRKFRTDKHKRSKLHNQFVIRTYGFFYKEISLRLYRSSKSKKSSLGSFNLSNPRLAFPAFIIIGVAGMLYFSLNITTQKYLKPTVNAYSAPAIVEPKPVSINRSEPTKLRIQKIEVDTSVMAIGLRSDGTLDVPSSPELVGWYTGSPTPGEIGPAVIDGHVDSPDGVAIFWRLGELQPGDMFEVDRLDSSMVKFKVDRVVQYPQDSFPTTEVYGDINYAGIRLITCSGTFDSVTHRYSHNTVVFGSLIP